MDEHRALIFPPSRRDGEATRLLLERARIPCQVCMNAEQVADGIRAGAGTLILTDAALSGPDIDLILEALAAQPPWSDLPIVLLWPPNRQTDVVARAVDSLTNVTLLERPASARTLLSAVQAALRGRKRQYETREQLAALKKAEETLRARERQLRDADRRKDEFLAMLAHELRNPLAPIRNVSEVLTHSTSQDVRVHGMADILTRQIAHLTRIVDDLLDVSRITQGRIELQRETVDLAVVVGDALESVQPLIAERGHKLCVSSVAQQVWVDGDSARLVQCVSNILINAAKYTDPGGTIEVAVRDEQGVACITVSDNGVGISGELLPRVFELFVQSARSLDRSEGGLGIGLSVVRRLIEMHGGAVTASSDGPGRGARFEIRLPLSNAPALRASAAPSTPVGLPKRILVVDDNRDAAESLVMILNFAGHDARAAYSAAEALESAQALTPEVILLDIGLPGMDGYQVASLIRARQIPTQIVAITGYGQAEDIRKAATAGIDAHLVKPVDLRTLEATLAALSSKTPCDNVLTFGRRQHNSR